MENAHATITYKEGILKKAGELNRFTKPRYFQLWVDPPVFSYLKKRGGQLINTVRLQGPDNTVNAKTHPFSIHSHRNIDLTCWNAVGCDVLSRLM